MKLNHYLFLSWALLTSLTACKHDQENINPSPTPGTEQPDESGTATKVGQPNGALISQTIGPEGGIISTSDGTVKLIIPAGAVDKATAISIQPITNENPNGLGQAFRFSPEGQKFLKPATLTFTYDPAKISSENVENFGIAYQRENGVWYDVMGSNVNTTQHTISVPMEHFSDWTPYELAQFEFSIIDAAGRPGSGFTLQPGESVDLYAGLLTYNNNYPKDAKEKPLKQTKGFGQNWQLIGEGKLTDNKADGATYTAPAKVPQQNPVLVTTELTFQGKKFKLILIQKIHIGLDTYFDISVNNFPREVTAFACTRIAGKVYLACVVGDETLALQIHAGDLGVQNYPYYSSQSREKEANKADAIFKVNDPTVGEGWISHYYDSCSPGTSHSSPGSVQIEKVEITNGKKYVSGHFFSIVYRTEGICNKGFKLHSMPITGSFRMEVLTP